jgi:hypothetical protein
MVIQKHPAPAGLDWLMEGTRLIFRKPGLVPQLISSHLLVLSFIGLFVVLLRCLSYLPIVGNFVVDLYSGWLLFCPILTLMFLPLISASNLLVCRNVASGKKTLPKNFSRPGSLLVFYTFSWLFSAAAIAGIYFLLASFLANDYHLNEWTVILLYGAGFLTLLPATFVLNFAPLLIVVHGQGPLEAMANNLLGILKNFGAFFVNGIFFTIMVLLFWFLSFVFFGLSGNFGLLGGVVFIAGLIFYFILIGNNYQTYIAVFPEHAAA